MCSMCIKCLVGSVCAVKLGGGGCLCRVRADARAASAVMHGQGVVAWPGGQGLAVVPEGWPAGDIGSGDACVVGRGCAWRGGVSILQSPWEVDGACGMWSRAVRLSA